MKCDEIIEDTWMGGHPLFVPTEEQYGASSRRPWRMDDDQHVWVAWRDIICLVDVDDTGCLTATSLERLWRLGLEVDGASLS